MLFSCDFTLFSDSLAPHLNQERKGMSRRNWITETLLVTAGLLVVIGAYRLIPSVAHIGYIGHALVPWLWILVPWGLITFRGESPETFGLRTDDIVTSARTGLLVSLVILLPYFLIFAFFFGRPTVPASGWPAVTQWLKMSLYQLFVIALPEEFFFRGYLQTRLNQLLGQPFNLFGVAIGWGLVLTAFIFMIFHLLFAINIWNLGVFLPALVMGWLKDKTGSITAPIVFHALSNIFLYSFQGRF